MSRVDLDKIQAQLKVAIQSHQVLVAKMKNDPQSTPLQKQLHELQAQITGLSEKQKSIVQSLRKELVTKQGPTSVVQVVTQSGRPPTIAQLTSAHNIRPPLSVSLSAVTAQPKKPSHNNNSIKVRPAVTAPGSLPLRVPVVAATRPSILMGGSSQRPPRPAPAGPRTAVAVLKNSTVSNLPLVRRGSEADLIALQKSALGHRELPPEELQKLEYMASLDLITPDTLKEIQQKRSERKRRSTANPQFSYGHFEPERKRSTTSYLKQGHITMETRKRVRLQIHNHFNLQPSAEICFENDVHEDFCASCGRSGELLMCDTCNLVYHLACLEPPLTTIPQGLWSCPKCYLLNKQQGGTGGWPGSLALVHSYITAKAAKEEEQKKMERRNLDLIKEKRHLEAKSKQLSEAIAQVKRKAELLHSNCMAQKSADKLKHFIQIFQTS